MPKELFQLWCLKFFLVRPKSRWFVRFFTEEKKSRTFSSHFLFATQELHRSSAFWPSSFIPLIATGQRPVEFSWWVLHWQLTHSETSLFSLIRFWQVLQLSTLFNISIVFFIIALYLRHYKFQCEQLSHSEIAILFWSHKRTKIEKYLRYCSPTSWADFSAAASCIPSRKACSSWIVFSLQEKKRCLDVSSYSSGVVELFSDMRSSTSVSLWGIVRAVGTWLFENLEFLFPAFLTDYSV